MRYFGRNFSLNLKQLSERLSPPLILPGNAGDALNAAERPACMAFQQRQRSCELPGDTDVKLGTPPLKLLS
jgi:hypothetical protein